NLPTHRVAGAQIKLSYLRGRNINVVRAGKVVIFRRAQETETIGKRFEHTFGENQATLLSLGRQHLEDQLLFAHSSCAGDVHAFGDAGQLGDRHLLEIGKV